MRARKIESGYFLRLERGEEIVSTILDFVAKEKIQAGTVSGIGALNDVTLGFFDRRSKQYLKETFTDVYELLSLLGNISYVDAKPILHAHCVLGRADFSVLGGHLFSGQVAVTGEFYIRVFPEKFSRSMNDDFSLNLLDF